MTFSPARVDEDHGHAGRRVHWLLCRARPRPPPGRASASSRSVARRAPTKRTRAPSRAAATAWFAPLPPDARERRAGDTSPPAAAGARTGPRGRGSPSRRRSAQRSERFSPEDDFASSIIRATLALAGQVDDDVARRRGRRRSRARPAVELHCEARRRARAGPRAPGRAGSRAGRRARPRARAVGRARCAAAVDSPSRARTSTASSGTPARPAPARRGRPRAGARAPSRAARPRRLAVPGAALGAVGLELEQVAPERLLEPGQRGLGAVGRAPERGLAPARRRTDRHRRAPSARAAGRTRAPADLARRELRDHALREGRGSSTRARAMHVGPAPGSAARRRSNLDHDRQDHRPPLVRS